MSARPVEESAPSGMLDSLGLILKTASEVRHFYVIYFLFLSNSLNFLLL